MNAKSVIHNAIRRCGFDIVRCPFPDWLPLREHLRDIFSRLAINCVLDVGANFGQYGSFLRRCGYEGWIISFEPIADNFEKLSRQIATDSRWRAYQYALGDEEQSLPINVTQVSLFSSFLKPNAYCSERFGDEGRIQRTEHVTVKRLDSVLLDLISEIPDPRVYLKVDAQGYDLNVIKGLGTQVALIRALQTELSVQSIYSGVTGYLTSLQTLSELGFEPTGFFPVNRDQDHVRVIEFDCIMTRSARRRESASAHTGRPQADSPGMKSSDTKLPGDHKCG